MITKIEKKYVLGKKHIALCYKVFLSTKNLEKEIYRISKIKKIASGNKNIYRINVQEIVLCL